MVACPMTPEQRADLVVRLVAVQHTLRTLCEAAESSAQVARDAGGEGLAFATLMLKEAIAEYGLALTRFVLEDGKE